MKFLKKWGILLVSILFLAIIAVLVLVGMKSINEYKSTIDAQKASIEEMDFFIQNDIGPLVDCYVINRQVRVGDTITEDMLDPISIPEKVAYTTKMVTVEKEGNKGAIYYEEEPETTINVVTNKNDVVGKKFRVSLGEGQLLLTDYVTDSIIGNSERIFQMVINNYDVNIKAGDYVDIRIKFTYGEDFIAIPHKRVESVNVSSGMFTFHFSEDEIATYSSMLLDMAMYPACEIYVLRYIDSESQTAAQAYYPMNTNVAEILAINPNILELVEQEMILEREQLNAIMGGDMDSFDEKELENLQGTIEKMREDLNKSIAGGIKERVKAEEAAAKAAAKAKK